jgi:hypothetical protein
MPVKKYCGNSDVLPEGYDEFGDLFSCTKKGFGICKYNGKLGTRYNGLPPDPDRPKIYCGNKQELPPGYERFGLRNECLKRGFGRCMFTQPPAQQQQQQAPPPAYQQQQQQQPPPVYQQQQPRQQQRPRQPRQTQQQFIRVFRERFGEQNFTRNEIQRLFGRLTEAQKRWFNTNFVISQSDIHGFYKIMDF